MEVPSPPLHFFCLGLALKSNLQYAFTDPPVFQFLLSISAYSANMSLRLRIMLHSLCYASSSPFPTALHSLDNPISRAACSIMRRRLLDLSANDDTVLILFLHCQTCMDPQGDHVTHCTTGYGVWHRHRHHYVCNVFAEHMFGPAGFAFQIEGPVPIPGTNPWSTYVLVHPSSTNNARTENPRHISYALTLCSPFSSN